MTTDEEIIDFAEWVSRNTYVFDGSRTIKRNGDSRGIAKGKRFCRIDYTMSENNSGWTTADLLTQYRKEKQTGILLTASPEA